LHRGGFGRVVLLRGIVIVTANTAKRRPLNGRRKFPLSQLGRIYLDMLNVYKCLSENISAAIMQNGEVVMKQPLIRSMRTVKKETLKLISGWVSRANDLDMVRETCHVSCFFAWADPVYMFLFFE